MVIGQLFMKLAPTVTIKLGAIIPKTEGNALVVTNAFAKSSVTPAFFYPFRSALTTTLPFRLAQYTAKRKTVPEQTTKETGILLREAKT